jgi:hypothetical protein
MWRDMKPLDAAVFFDPLWVTGVWIGQPRNTGFTPCGSNGLPPPLQIVQLVLGPTHFPTQMLPEAAVPEVRRPGHKTDQ